MENHRSGLGRERRLGAVKGNWPCRIRTDKHCAQPQSVLEKREHDTAIIFVKGTRSYARKLLEFQTFPNRHQASKALIQNSRRLLETSRLSIVRTKNILAFSRDPHKFVN
jgi:hypothetical protein